MCYVSVIRPSGPSVKAADGNADPFLHNDGRAAVAPARAESVDQFMRKGRPVPRCPGSEAGSTPYASPARRWLPPVRRSAPMEDMDPAEKHPVVPEPADGAGAAAVRCVVEQVGTRLLVRMSGELTPASG